MTLVGRTDIELRLLADGRAALSRYLDRPRPRPALLEALHRTGKALFTGIALACRAPTGAIAMSMQSVASPALSSRPPNRNSPTHIPGAEAWPLLVNTL